MTFGAREDGLVNLAIGILSHHGASRAVGSHRASAVTDRKIATGKAVLVLNQALRSLDEFLTRTACFQHPGEVGIAKNVAEKVFRITGNPAVALGDRPFRVY